MLRAEQRKDGRGRGEGGALSKAHTDSLVCSNNMIRRLALFLETSLLSSYWYDRGVGGRMNAEDA